MARPRALIRRSTPVLRRAVLAAAALAMAFGGTSDRRATAETPTRLRLAPPPALAFARATEPRPFRLPEDHGPHFEFQTEWWYYTGHLAAADGRAFGFQLTFFRRGLSPGPPPAGGFATNQVYFAHLAVTDVAGGRHAAAERWSRGAAGLAGAAGRPFRVWLEDWSADAGAEALGPRLSADGSAVRIRALEGGLELDLELRAAKPLVAHGDRGLSPKSQEPGNASYYVGYTRMDARGRLGFEGKTAEVAGEAWFDHEWSTSALGSNAVGWDWFSLQLDDRRELMYFEIRRQDGSREPASGGTLVEPDGRTRRLLGPDVAVEVLDRWTSPTSGAVYPSRWRVRVPAENIDFEVVPLVRDQEMRTSFTYWEGAVRLSGRGPRGPVAGRGYVEMTGYSRSMQGVF